MIGHFRGLRSGHALNRRLLDGAVRRRRRVVLHDDGRAEALDAAVWRAPRLASALRLTRLSPRVCSPPRRSVAISAGDGTSLGHRDRRCASRRLSCCGSARLALSCSGLPPAATRKNDAYVEKPVEELYNKAMDQFVDGRLHAAPPRISTRSSSQHPYSVWATKAPADGAYALYQDEQLRRGDRRGRPLHPAPSRQSRHRLRLLSEGDLLLHPDHRCRPRPEDDRAGAEARSTRWCAASRTANTRATPS